MTESNFIYQRLPFCKFFFLILIVRSAAAKAIRQNVSRENTFPWGSLSLP
jgi:hypothetical protein